MKRFRWIGWEGAAARDADTKKPARFPCPVEVDGGVAATCDGCGGPFEGGGRLSDGEHCPYTMILPSLLAVSCRDGTHVAPTAPVDHSILR